MKSMELHFGVIRDKQGIHAGLLNSRSKSSQLAVCYRSDDKLLVKICYVMAVPQDEKGMVILRTNRHNLNTEIKVRLENIQSIYPIRDFDHEA